MRFRDNRIILGEMRWDVDGKRVLSKMKSTIARTVVGVRGVVERSNPGI